MNTLRYFDRRIPALLLAFLLVAAGCGTKHAEEEENNLESQERQDSSFYDEGGELSLIQGDRIIGEGLAAGQDSIDVIADIEGKGKEWDIICRKSAPGGVISLAARDERGTLYPLSDIAGLGRSGELPPGRTIEVAVAHLVDTRGMEVLCAVGDGESEAMLSIYRLARSGPRAFVRIGALEGESHFILRRGGRIDAPYGTRGVTRRYAWNGGAFEEIPEPPM